MHLQLRPAEMGHFLRTIALLIETTRGVNVARQAAAIAPILMRTPRTIFTSSLKSNQAERERAGDEVYFFSGFAVWIGKYECDASVKHRSLFVWREVMNDVTAKLEPKPTKGFFSSSFHNLASWDASSPVLMALLLDLHRRRLTRYRHRGVTPRDRHLYTPSLRA